jgi:predicted NACHT family NTPase
MPIKRFLATLFLAVAPPAVVAFFGKEVIGAHPYWALALFALYQVLVWLFGLAGEVLKELKPRLVKAAADQLADFVSDWRFRRRYFEQLRNRNRVFDLRALRTRATYPLEIERLYVDVAVAPGNPQTVRTSPVLANTAAGRCSIWEFLTRVDTSSRCLAIVGPPGAGKTTLLRHVTLALSRRIPRYVPPACRRLVPVYLPLRDFTDQTTSDASPTLADLLTTQEHRHGTSPPSTWFTRKLEAKKCLILLDGLDEVADNDQRRTVSLWVDKQMELYGGNRFLVTSRPHGYLAAPLNNATVLELQPLTLAQVGQFIRSWYQSSEAPRLPGGAPNARTGTEMAADLLQRLQGNPSIADLAVNPLLLTMIAMVHTYRGFLPNRRVELYAEICDVFLCHRQEEKGLAPRMPLAETRRVLQVLAAHLMQEGIREIPAKDAVSTIRRSFLAARVSETYEPKDFLKDVTKDSALLIEREVGIYSFAHVTLQGLFAFSSG